MRRARLAPEVLQKGHADPDGGAGFGAGGGVFVAGSRPQGLQGRRRNGLETTLATRRHDADPPAVAIEQCATAGAGLAVGAVVDAGQGKTVCRRE